MTASDCHTHFKCVGEAACQDAIINGRPGIDLMVACIGLDACKTLTLNCGAGKCELYCSDDGASCEDMKIDTTLASSFVCTGLIDSICIYVVYCLWFIQLNLYTLMLRKLC